MRGWVSVTDHRWVMRCDGGVLTDSPCPVTGPVSDAQPDLQPYRDAGWFIADAGWFIAEKSGDLCQRCRPAVVDSGKEGK